MPLKPLLRDISVGTKLIPYTLDMLSDEIEVLYDFNDLSTLWQDVEATTPATEGDNVALAEDTHVNNINLIQNTLSLQPVVTKLPNSATALEFDLVDDVM